MAFIRWAVGVGAIWAGMFGLVLLTGGIFWPNLASFLIGAGLMAVSWRWFRSQGV